MKKKDAKQPEKAQQAAPADEEDEPYMMPPPDEDGPWAPSSRVIFFFSIIFRLLASFFSIIDDCDETYNYWEPTHYLAYGSGLQTWEYSPVYALRSYAYLFLHSVPAQVFAYLGMDKILTFYLMRFSLGVISSFCEIRLYEAVLRKFGPHVARLFALFLITSPGMYHASVSFLPSSFAMLMTTIAYGWWLDGNVAMAIGWLGIGALFGWPFAAMAGAPIALEVLYRFGFWGLLNPALQTLVKCCIALVAIDSYMYGKLVLAPFNIMYYNVFSSATGSHLYGVEPAHYYLMNGLLNFPLYFWLALLAPVLAALNRKLPPGILATLSAAPLFVLFFSLQAHKEERFLFPVYPMVALSASYTIYAIRFLFEPVHETLGQFVRGSARIFIFFCVLLSFSRIYALRLHYSAPMKLFESVYDRHALNTWPDNKAPAGNYSICIGDEWYQFPSSFFLHPTASIKFVEGSFGGQLPQPFLSADGTTAIRTNFNDLNRREPDRYIPLEQCDYLVENVPFGASSRYSNATWQAVDHFSMLDNAASPSQCRAFYIPFLSEQHCRYGDFLLLKNKHR